MEHKFIDDIRLLTKEDPSNPLVTKLRNALVIIACIIIISALLYQFSVTYTLTDEMVNTIDPTAEITNQLF